MKLSKRVIGGLASVMMLAAVGTSSVWAETAESEPAAAQEVTCQAFSAADMAKDGENAYTPYFVNFCSEEADEGEGKVTYTITTASDVSMDGMYTIDVSQELNARPISYKIFMDGNSAKLMTSFDGGKTWTEVPMKFQLETVE